MTKLRLSLDEELEEAIAAVREREGLETLDQAAEWLLRRRLRKGTQSLTGRGRALCDVKGGRR